MIERCESAKYRRRMVLNKDFGRNNPMFILYALYTVGVVYNYFRSACALSTDVKIKFAEKETLRNMLSDEGLIFSREFKSSSIFCARLCLEYGTCISYFENSGIKECRFISKVLKQSEMVSTGLQGWKYFVLSSCPVEKGYTLNVSVNICFKLFQLELSIPDANQRCTEEGGRLLRIANLEQSNAVASHLENFLLNNHSPTVDGSYNELTGNWEYSDGTIMEYFNWRQGHPKTNWNCLKVSYYSNFQLASSLCSRSNYFVCEVPAIQ